MFRARFVLPLILLGVVSTGCGTRDADSPPSSAAPGEVPCAYLRADSASRTVRLPPSSPDPSMPGRMLISTSAGDIPVTFDASAAPCTVSSFVSLAKQGYFTGSTCHRLTTEVIFVLQCGDPSGTGSGGPGYTIPDELVADDPRLQPCDDTGVCTYGRGYLAMANSGTPGSGGSQFFLVYRDSPLPATFTVFGRTNAGGLKVLQAIGARRTADGSNDGPPAVSITITDVR